MDLDAIIAQLKSYAPVFEGRVAGGVTFESIKDQVWQDFPAAYVIPLEEEAGENDQ